MKKLIFGLIVIATAMTVSCADSVKKEFEKSVKIFLTDFQNRLQGNDEEIFKLFVTSQNKDEILKAIRILQNRDSVVKVKILFDSAQLFSDDVRVEIPVHFISKDESQERSVFTLKLFRKNGKFYIHQLVAEKLYSQFFILKNKIENAEAIARLMADVKIYYDRAKELQKNYDTVVWFAHHKNMTYYYAVNGQYNFDSLKKEKPQDFKMGLVDETGKVIVPVEFDLIGNPSINLPEVVEVRKNGKIGYYSLEGKEILPTIYEWLIPYEENETVALVKKDSTYGWLDKDFVYHENFPSEKAEQSVKEFSYLTDNTFSFGAKHNELINILYPLKPENQYQGTGMIIPSNYFVKNGLFASIQDGYLSYKRDSLVFQYGDDYNEVKSQKTFSISETIDAFISDFKHRYVGGRSEFYTEHKVIVVDKKRDVLSSLILYGDSDFKFRKLNDSLCESSAQFEMGGGFFGGNFPSYSYYKFDGHQLTQLESKREFQTTQFVRLDSSYLSGDFTIWDKYGKQTKSNFVDKQSLNYMRNEILADYGFIFANPELMNSFYHRDNGLVPTTGSYEEVYAKASEIDKYNLDFLNRLIGSTPSESNL